MTYNSIYAINKHKDDKVKRDISTQKVTKKLFCTLFFIGMTIYGYFVLSKTEYLPWFMGGNAATADLMKLYMNYPT